MFHIFKCWRSCIIRCHLFILILHFYYYTIVTYMYNILSFCQNITLGDITVNENCTGIFTFHSITALIVFTFHFMTTKHPQKYLVKPDLYTKHTFKAFCQKPWDLFSARNSIRGTHCSGHFHLLIVNDKLVSQETLSYTCNIFRMQFALEITFHITTLYIVNALDMDVSFSFLLLGLLVQTCLSFVSITPTWKNTAYRNAHYNEHCTSVNLNCSKLHICFPLYAVTYQPQWRQSSVIYTLW